MRHSAGKFIIIVLMAVSSCPTAVQAEHPIDIQRKTAEGNYFDALVSFQSLPRRRLTTGAILAAAKSAWGLGLVGKATEFFEKALADQSLDSTTRARIYLSRGIIEFQEERYRVAMLYAEKAIALLEAGPLRARSWMLWGESLYQLGSWGAALTKYDRALEEADPTLKGEIHFKYGRCALRLGEQQTAREHFEQVPVDSERTPEAIRYLALIALDLHEYKTGDFWLKKGREEFPEQFLDSWVDYAMLQVAIEQDNIQAVRKIRSAAAKKYPPSDPWFTLLDAAAEIYEWEGAQSK
ncbi:MAG: tetratricopeptide repeat protein [Candidatus Dadabacteria bacterium]|nr:MAG: tetratricopeptide repeat protein [Candidatus Dadabacteria bacterium]